MKDSNPVLINGLGIKTTSDEIFVKKINNRVITWQMISPNY